MFIEDLSEFFDTTEMADLVIVGNNSVVGVFDNQFVEVHGVEGFRPVFVCSEADVFDVTHGESLVFNNSTYKVAGVQRDGTGLISLILEKQ